jgi:hypothetical protein
LNSWNVSTGIFKILKKMAGLLQREDKDELLKWIGGRRKFKLLYKISRDGCSNVTFHSKCDNKGMTVTVLYNSSDTVYGGFTSQNWTSAGGAYVSDPKAFLFQLKYNGQWSPKQYLIKPDKSAKAIYCHPDYGPYFGGGHDRPYFGEEHDGPYFGGGRDGPYFGGGHDGPYFGGGHDLGTFNGTLTPSNDVFALNGGCSFNSTYDMKGIDLNSFANGNLEVKELEVYQVDGEFRCTHPWCDFGTLCYKISDF